MCGRTACYLARDDIGCACKYRNATGKESEVPWVAERFQNVNYVPSYNLGPRDTLPCIVDGSHFNNRLERVICPMMWGMIPPWHTGEHRRHKASTHNARLEGVAASKMYGKPLIGGKRCIVVVNGFYEWHTDKKSNTKQPYYIYKKTSEGDERQLLYLAGLFEKWTGDEGVDIYSCTILTRDASSELAWLHHRAPVILQTEKKVEDWLNYKENTADTAIAKLANAKLSENALQWHPVGSTVNNVRNKDSSCKDPIELGKKKPPTNGLMSAWLKTGSMKRHSTDSVDGEDPASQNAVKKSKAV